ncbi:MAG TPA: anti-sigma factor antagonist [Rhodobacterales bacterium]|nr:anti-sigma factor antagonist [Rhodobacterales bacterium]
MELTHKDVNGTRLIEVGGSRLDAAVAIRFKDEMRVLTEDGPERIVLDMQNIDFLDSSGLGAVVAAMKLAGSTHRLELAGLTPTVEKVFSLTRMDSVFTIHASAEAAMGADYVPVS